MLSDFLRLITEVIQFIWPFRIVSEWEHGVYYVNGQVWREVGPGLYPVVPWFCDVRTVDMVPGIVSTRRQDITVADGTILSFAASAWACVTDATAAMNRVDQYLVTVREVVEAVLADRLAAVDVERLAPDKRARLLADCRKWIEMETQPFGVEITKVRFTSFVTRVKAHRLLVDQVQDPGTW